MKRSRLVAAALALASFAGIASATPYRMDYCKTDVGGGLYRYEITLTLDNNDGSWFAGQGIGWIIFGDIPSATSPFNDWVMDPASYPIGPYTEITGSGGGHNGPTLGPIWTPPGPPTLFEFNLWKPTAIGDSISWAGTSASNLNPGELTWSNLWTGGGANNADWAVAVVDCGSTCYPDCNLSGNLTLADFGCFQGKYVLGDLYADCNNSGTLSLADFGCFQSAYVLGCP